jgi:hypothetical protein
MMPKSGTEGTVEGSQSPMQNREQNIAKMKLQRGLERESECLGEDDPEELQTVGGFSPTRRCAARSGSAHLSCS